MEISQKLQELRISEEPAEKAIRNIFPAFVGDVKEDFKVMLDGIEGIDPEKLLAKPFGKWPENAQKAAEHYLRHRC